MTSPSQLWISTDLVGEKIWDLVRLGETRGVLLSPQNHDSCPHLPLPVEAVLKFWVLMIQKCSITQVRNVWKDQKGTCKIAPKCIYIESSSGSVWPKNDPETLYSEHDQSIKPYLIPDFDFGVFLSQEDWSSASKHNGGKQQESPANAREVGSIEMVMRERFPTKSWHCIEAYKTYGRNRT